MTQREAIFFLKNIQYEDAYNIPKDYPMAENPYKARDKELRKLEMTYYM